MKPFPRTLDKDIWENYLDRELTRNEENIFDNLISENRYNNDIEKLNDIIKKENLYIPSLTDLNGNCLFETFKILGLYKDESEFRKSLSIFMNIFKDSKNIFKMNGEERSLQELFNDTNEIEHVYCNGNGVVYKYTYDIMCEDISNECSWTRLPTELIIMFTSLLFKIKFVIIKLNFRHEIDMNQGEKDDIPILYLGHIGELHYIPVATRPNNYNADWCPEYTKRKKEFLKWAAKMELSVNNGE